MAPRLQVPALVAHAGRLTLGAVLMVAGAHWAPLALVGALALYLAAFALTHDLVHGSLGLPRRLNEVALSLTSLPMLVSGHTMKLMHLLHHRKPLAKDDVEGVGATLPLWRALLAGPMNAAQYRVESFRTARGMDRSWMVAETLVSLLLTAAALATRSTIGAAWVVVNLTMQLTASVWASHLTHRPPATLLAIARHLEWTGSAVIASFVHHDKHHRAPWIPCGQL